MIMLLFSLICFLTIYMSERTFSHIPHLPAFEVSRKYRLVGFVFFFHNGKIFADHKVVSVFQSKGRKNKVKLFP